MLRFCKPRTYHDPVHGAIRLDGSRAEEALIIRLIDTPPFQRLRRIRQLDTAYFTFHGAEGSRFTHSLGVLHVTQRVFDLLAGRHPQLQPYRGLALAAALLHDIGHSPFSHAGEKMFGCHHERWTLRILHEEPTIRSLLEHYDPSLPAQIRQVLTKTHPIRLLTQLVSSQLDCDRLDYLLRDSLHTGAQYGHLDLDRILTVLDYDPERTDLRIPARKGLGAIEHYLVVRYFMYSQVYQHPKSMAARFLLDRLYQRARALILSGSLEGDEILTAWLTQEVDELPLRQFLMADDIVFTYPFPFWAEHPDRILADLARRFLTRQIFTSRLISGLDPQQQQALYQHLWQRAGERWGDPGSYVGIRQSHVQGYTLYHQGIELETDQGRVEIARLSPLVQALTRIEPQTWLIFPKELGADVQEFLA
ncbi:MAG: HD domain-containing protein [Thermostichales cyanobacterium SZTDM-1c_bins_54]